MSEENIENQEDAKNIEKPPLNPVKIFFISVPSIVLLVVIIVLIQAKLRDGSFSNPIEVTASAYNSVPGQTDSTPTLAAWGDTLRPGMKAIAVSYDLIQMGLTHNTEVKIIKSDGSKLPGIYLVKDKMNKRWTKKIDIYMGNDINASKQWGKQKVKILWRAKKKSKK